MYETIQLQGVESCIRTLFENVIRELRSTNFQVRLNSVPISELGSTMATIVTRLNAGINFFADLIGYTIRVNYFLGEALFTLLSWAFGEYESI